MKYSAILAGGEGSRLSEEGFKPLVKIGNDTLLELSLKRLLKITDKKTFILFNEKGREYNLGKIGALNDQKIEYFFESPPSSLHSIYQIFKRFSKRDDCDHLLVSMIDTIIKEKDFNNFISFCETLKEHESAIITTNHIDDERPLTLNTNKKGKITAFQVPVKDDTQVTSGIYYLSFRSLNNIEKCLHNNIERMRNFLKWLVDDGQTIYAFNVAKTIDVDRPSDIKAAQGFLNE